MLRLKNNKGIGSTELFISIIFMLVMGVYCWKILDLQKQSLIISNQNIEIVNIVNSMRKALSRPGTCKLSFDNMFLNTGVGEIDALYKLNTNNEQKEIFPVSRFNNTKYGLHGLEIKSYELNKTSLNGNDFDLGTNLIITFGRGFEDKTVKKDIKVFATDVEGRIVDCSLGYVFDEDKSFWRFSENGNALLDKRLIVGEDISDPKSNWQVLVNGGVKLGEMTDFNCDKLKNGSIFILKNKLNLCYREKVFELYKFGGIY